MGSDITGEIYFYRLPTTDGSPPWVDVSPALVRATNNFAQIPTRVTIHDLRGKENTVDLDTNGFEILKYDGNVHDPFDDNSDTQRNYYQDIIAVFKKHLGASHAVIFNHIIRYRGPSRPAEQCDQTHKNPIFYAHVDNDPSAVRFKMEQLFGKEEAEKLMQKRFQLINVWRPLGSNPVMNIPLTICDYRSLDPENDIHLVNARGSISSVSAYALSHNAQDAQRWYYLSQMRSNEMFFFKIFDNNSDVAQFGPHTGFINENVPPSNIEQISIEMRCFVFYDE